jgi:hypothetical protein
LGLTQPDGEYVATIITNEKCNNVRISVSNNVAGTFTFSNIELRRKD